MGGGFSTAYATYTTTTRTSVETIIGTEISCTVSNTEITHYWVREDWVEYFFGGVFTLITEIYEIILEIKVDPIVEETIVEVTGTCTTPTTTTTPRTRVVGGVVRPVYELSYAAPYLLMIAVGLLLVLSKQLLKRSEKT